MKGGARRLGAALLLLAAAALSACAPTQRQLVRAQQLVDAQADHALDCAAADHCAAPSSLRTLAAADGSGNRAVILDLGEDALIARLNLIRAAREHIAIQTYIWAEDDAGNLVLDELLRAARRGVHVQILADQLGSFGDAAALARLARTHVNLELRLYNPTLHNAVTGPFGYVAGGLCCFYRLNQRMHNKLLLVDDAVGITGGRNYQDRYFDWDPEFNYLDRDVLVAGPVAGAMRRSFDQYWRHERSVPLTHLRDVGHQLLQDGPGAAPWQAPPWKHPDRVAHVRALAADPAYIHSHFVARAHELDEAAYFADHPGKTDAAGVEEDRALTARLRQALAHAETEIVLQTPYLVLSSEAQKLFRHLGRERPDLTILVSTSSLAAIDSLAVYAAAHKRVRRHLALYNFNIYEQKPYPLDAPRMIAHYHALGRATRTQPSGPGSGGRRGSVPVTSGGVRISLHAKSAVIDSHLVMIGSHNFDARSDTYNTESGLLVRDPEFARVVRASILASMRPGNAWVIAKRKVDNVGGRINRALAKISAQLPIFDLWPFGYATSWELLPGCSPMLRTDPRFHECYRPVGEFPEVDLPLRTIYTRLFKAFGAAGISGLL